MTSGVRPQCIAEDGRGHCGRKRPLSSTVVPYGKLTRTCLHLLHSSAEECW